MTVRVLSTPPDEGIGHPELVRLLRRATIDRRMILSALGGPITAEDVGVGTYPNGAYTFGDGSTGTKIVIPDVLGIAKGGAGLADLQIRTPNGSIRVLDDAGTTAIVQIEEPSGNITTIGTLTAAGLALAIRTVSTDITAAATDHTLLVNAVGANRTITLPAAASNAKRLYKVKKIDASGNTVTIDGNASETIDGATTKVLSTQYQSIEIHCDGTSWWIVG